LKQQTFLGVPLWVHEMLVKHGLTAQVIIYVKGEASNLSTMTTIFTSIISCEMLKMATPFCGVMLSNTICGGVLCLSVANMTQIILKFVLATSISIKETQFILQKKSHGLKNRKG
jgi:hypothetical protein